MWKDFQELEDSLSMPELNAILTESRKQRYDDRRFIAAVNQIDLEAGATEDEFARVQQNAAKRVAALTGEEPETFDPNIREAMGFGLDYEDLTNG